MSRACYFCNKNQGVELRKLLDLRSKHSDKLITDFIHEFQSDFKSERNVYDEFNRICSQCLSRIYAYDWTCMRLKDQEKELRTLLMYTETKTRLNTPEVDGLQQDVMNIKVEDEIDIKPVITTPKPIIIQPSLSVSQSTQHSNIQNHNASSAAPNSTVQNAKRSKPIIVRVVKRVPFLKTNPAAPVAQAKQATVVKPITVATASGRPLKKVIRQAPPNKRTSSGSQKQCETQSEATGDGIPIKCEYCGTVFSHINRLRSHLKQYHPDWEAIECALCKFKLKDKQEYQDHMAKHDSAGPNQCVICNEVGLVDDFDLKKHVKVKHAIANLLCELCGKTFVFAKNWRRHQATHTEERPEHCPICDKAFKCKHTLQHHLQTHENSEFTCVFCDKKFKRKDNLRAHERRHRTDTKKNKCSFCPAAFESKSDLKLHLRRKHDAEIPHDKIRKSNI